MDRKLRQALKSAFDAPKAARKVDFLNSLPYPKATNLEFFLSQIGYIRKRFWCLSVLLLIGMAALSLTFKQGKEIVGEISAVLPLLTLIGITEINKSVSFRMTELEMSCKYNLADITLIRLCVIGAFHFIILLFAMLLFKDKSQYGMFRYGLYLVTPFLLSSYLAFWVTNHIKSKDTLYICSGVTAFVFFIIHFMDQNFAVIYAADYTLLWSMALLVIAALLTREIYVMLTERNKQWSFV